MISAPFPELRLAKLLGLTPEEYKQLKHSPFMENRNDLGIVIGYFMHISPENDTHLLEKLGMQGSSFKLFSVQDIAKLKN